MKATVKQLTDDLYAALQDAVEEYGGTLALAAELGKSHPLISLRVRHAEDSKGVKQKATLDLVGHVAEDAAARSRFIASLCRQWGFKHPEPIAEPSTEEKYRALLAVLEGDVGESIRETAARNAGFDPSSFRR